MRLKAQLQSQPPVPCPQVLPLTPLQGSSNIPFQLQQTSTCVQTKLEPAGSFSSEDDSEEEEDYDDGECGGGDDDDDADDGGKCAGGGGGGGGGGSGGGGKNSVSRTSQNHMIETLVEPTCVGERPCTTEFYSEPQ
eukprot:TRINITY_DN4429_c0_g1_i7.p1 TRINITY_DN4429_c0_g1~~TRINITY_DN4429_c0_g1_i7.p1  ORF type:complete len:136 (-),score=54.33 TRINITY_DN4429_c0_g1_i7:92-499(-)